MTTRTRITPKSLALLARKFSADVDGARWALAELAAQAKAEGVPGWAAIVAAECRRAQDTVEKWARTWDWVEGLKLDEPPFQLPLTYSFYECAAKKTDLIDNKIVIELLYAYEDQPGATLESFRAQLSTLAGKSGYNIGDFPAWATKERAKILDWVDRAGISAHAAGCLQRAAAALADSLKEK